MNPFHFLREHSKGEESSISTSTSSSSDELEPVTQFKTMEQKKLGLTAYRGFSTSISHLFIVEEQEHGDLCSLLFCGVLQKERNRYVLTGEKPFRTMLVLFFRIVAAAFLLILSAYLMIEKSDTVGCFVLAEIILGLMFIYAVSLLRQRSKDSKKFRKDLLWNAFHGHGTGSALIPEEYQDVELADHLVDDYMQGQTYSDLVRAHACVSCYKTDIIDEEMDAPTPSTMCGCMWRCFSMMCCGKMGHFLQLCGMCAVAQESRELTRMIPAHQRAIDYVTFQDMLSYYSEILLLRQARDSNIFRHFLATSKLSQFIIYSFLVTCIAAAIICLLFKYSTEHFIFVVISFTVAVITTFMFHWPNDRMNISVDAVIKAFGYGFWIASTTAFFLEGLAGVLTEGSVYVSHNFFEVGNDDYYSARYSSVWDGTIGYNAAASYIHLGNGINREFWMRSNEVWYIAYLFFQCFFIAAFSEELLKYLAFRLLSDHPDFWSKTRLDDVIAGLVSTPETTTLNLNVLRKIESKLQERTLRKRAQAIIVAMIAVSLGYAACENLVYLCYYGNVTVDFNFFFVRTLLLPIHPICSVWQALGVCRRDVEKNSKFQMGRILLSAILWHGFFDFTVLVGAFALQKSKKDGIVYELIALLVPALIIVVSLIFVIFKVNKLLKEFTTLDTMSYRDGFMEDVCTDAAPIIASVAHIHSRDSPSMGSTLEITTKKTLPTSKDAKEFNGSVSDEVVGLPSIAYPLRYSASSNIVDKPLRTSKMSPEVNEDAAIHEVAYDASIANDHNNVHSDFTMGSIVETTFHRPLIINKDSGESSGVDSTDVVKGVTTDYPWHKSDVPKNTTESTVVMTDIAETNMFVASTINEDAAESGRGADTSSVTPDESETDFSHHQPASNLAVVRPEAEREVVDDVINRLRSTSSGSLPLANDDDVLLSRSSESMENGSAELSAGEFVSSNKSRLEIILGKLADDEK